MEELLDIDLLSICKRAFPKLLENKIINLLKFNRAVQEQITQKRIGTTGQPWEFNLRDVMRCCQLQEADTANGLADSNDSVYMDLLYVSRFRTEEDRKIVAQLASSMGLLRSDATLPRGFLKTELRKEEFVVGRACLLRNSSRLPAHVVKQLGHLQLLRSQSGVLEKLAVAIQNCFPVILVRVEQRV